MIERAVGNILDDPSDGLVCPVNCVGIMGKGLARQFKLRFPNNFDAYRVVCLTRELEPGKIFTFFDKKWIFNFPTKDHWSRPSRLKFIEDGLNDLVRAVKEIDVQSLAVPALGCGLGGLHWHDVRPLIESYLDTVPIKIRLYGPLKDEAVAR